MGAPIIMSALFHGFAIALLYVGLPYLNDHPVLGERVVVVEMVTIDEVRNLPEHGSELEKEKDRREESKVAEMIPPPSPPTPPSKANVPTRPPPKPSVAIEGPPPPKPVLSSADKERTKPVQNVRLPTNVEVPMRKPNPPSKPDPFASVLKSVEELELSRVAKPSSDDSDNVPPIEDLVD